LTRVAKIRELGPVAEADASAQDCPAYDLASLSPEDLRAATRRFELIQALVDGRRHSISSVASEGAIHKKSTSRGRQPRPIQFPTIPLIKN
jgi:hypothetical protein